MIGSNEYSYVASARCGALPSLVGGEGLCPHTFDFLTCHIIVIKDVTIVMNLFLPADIAGNSKRALFRLLKAFCAVYQR
jgi:hypothetical protein